MTPPTPGPQPGIRMNHLPQPWPAIVPRRPPSLPPVGPTGPVAPVVEPPGPTPTFPLRAGVAVA